MFRVFHCLSTLLLYVASDRQAAEFLLTKVNFKNSWAPHLGSNAGPTAQQAGILLPDHSAGQLCDSRITDQIIDGPLKRSPMVY